MRTKEELEITTNNSVYRKLYKRFVSRQIRKCDRCGWHRGENFLIYKTANSWKRYRRTQYK